MSNFERMGYTTILYRNYLTLGGPLELAELMQHFDTLDRIDDFLNQEVDRLIAHNIGLARS
jgi:hypothetical protein